MANKKFMVDWRTLLSGVAASTMVACGAAPGATESSSTEETNQAILHGTALTTDNWGVARVVVDSVHAWSCSAAILNDNWLLTAQHCVVDTDVNSNTLVQPSKFSIIQGTSGSYLKIVDHVYVHPYVDVALLHLTTALMNPTTGGSYRLGIYMGSDASLAPAWDGAKTVFCLGYGINDQGNMLLHGGYFTVDSTLHIGVPFNSPECPGNYCKQGWGFQIVRTDASQPLPYEGDSGGPCLLYNATFGLWGTEQYLAITGIEHGVDTSPSTDARKAYYVGAQEFRDWAWAIMGAGNSVFLDPNFGGPSGQGAARTFLPGTYEYPLYVPQDNHGTLMWANDMISSVKIPHAGAGAYPSLWLFPSGSDSSPISIYTTSSATLPTNIDNQASSLWAIDDVYLYADASFQGMGWQFDAGNHDFTQVQDEVVSSLHVPPGWRATLYTGHNYTGTSTLYFGGDYAFVGWDVNDSFSSISVEEPAVLYMDPSSTTIVDTGSGPFSYLFPGYYTISELGIPNDSLSSIRLPSGWSATLYWDDNFSGATRTISNAIYRPATTFNVDGAWDDKTSSIVIRKNISP